MSVAFGISVGFGVCVEIGSSVGIGDTVEIGVIVTFGVSVAFGISVGFGVLTILIKSTVIISLGNSEFVDLYLISYSPSGLSNNSVDSVENHVVLPFFLNSISVVIL